MTMFFFDKEPVWRQYIKELGIQDVMDSLKEKGYPNQWPAKVADIDSPYTFYHPGGKGWSCYRAECPNYEGYYLDGLYGGVKCTGCPEVLPGIVVGTMCRKEFTACPFYRDREG